MKDCNSANLTRGITYPQLYEFEWMDNKNLTVQGDCGLPYYLKPESEKQAMPIAMHVGLKVDEEENTTFTYGIPYDDVACEMGKWGIVPVGW